MGLIFLLECMWSPLALACQCILSCGSRVHSQPDFEDKARKSSHAAANTIHNRKQSYSTYSPPP